MYVCIVVTALFGLTVIVGTCVDSRVYDGIGIVISKLTQSLQVPYSRIVKPNNNREFLIGKTFRRVR